MIFAGILNLDDQIELFKMTVKQNLAKEYGSKKELSAYLSRSIFVFSIGNNDYLNNYLQPHQYNSSHRYTPQQFAQLLVDKLSQGLKVQRSYWIMKLESVLLCPNHKPESVLFCIWREKKSKYECNWEN